VASKRLLYVAHKHDASRLHYDFRLELDGVLKSWAVPKGPCLDPSQKRLAVNVEDHPVDYGSFEGIVPEGEYGAGTVMLWDRGWWEPLDDPAEAYAGGMMRFRLHGEKLKGIWKLVRFRGRSAEGDNWLLIKSRDEYVRPLSECDVLKASPDSVATGRSLEQIAADASGQA
jgi:bifunctional non-homologous end joining protein LigD